MYAKTSAKKSPLGLVPPGVMNSFIHSYQEDLYVLCSVAHFALLAVSPLIINGIRTFCHIGKQWTCSPRCSFVFPDPLSRQSVKPISSSLPGCPRLTFLLLSSHCPVSRI